MAGGPKIWGALFLLRFLVSYPLDSRNTKKLKIQKLKQQIFCKHPYFTQIFSKKAKITISLFMKNSKNNNIILGFSFMYLVSVYPTNRTFRANIFVRFWKTWRYVQNAFEIFQPSSLYSNSWGFIQFSFSSFCNFVALEPIFNLFLR